MSEFFPAPLVEAIRDGRAPAAAAVTTMGEKIWVEALASGGLGERRLADRMARIALMGQQQQEFHDGGPSSSGIEPTPLPRAQV